MIGRALHGAATSPKTLRDNVKGYVRAFDVRTGQRKWIFHTIPLKGEFGYDTWLDGEADQRRQCRRLGRDLGRRGAEPRLPAGRAAHRRR